MRYSWSLTIQVTGDTDYNYKDSREVKEIKFVASMNMLYENLRTQAEKRAGRSVCNEDI